MATNLVLTVFILGYTAIAFEQKIRVSKSASALVTGVIAWVIFMYQSADINAINSGLLEDLGHIAGILFFLLGAMTIVELIDSHNGFELISENISLKNKRQLVWLISALTFFLSALLDNMTTTIVMISIIRRFLHERKDRHLMAGLIVIAANSGGAWSPIGDVTTSMLWIGKQLTPGPMITSLFLPSLVCMLIPTVIIAQWMKGPMETEIRERRVPRQIKRTERNLIMVTGLLALLFVPVFKMWTHLEPFMGMLFSLGIMWILTEVIHRGKDPAEKGPLSVSRALEKADTPAILFFLGILLCISAMESIGILSDWAIALKNNIGNTDLIVSSIGLLSAIIDNVPLVAAVQGMEYFKVFPADDHFWNFLAYAAGTGGSILIIGSAAGVVAMGLEKISFFWYLKRISLPALLGYLGGAAAIVLL